MKPSGIGGWLILPAIGLIVTPVMLLVSLFRDLLPAFSPDVWQVLTDSGSESYHPMWSVTLIYELVANLSLLVFTLWLGHLFVQKSWRAPSAFISWLLINIAVQVVDLLLLLSVPAVRDSAPEVAGGIARSVLQAAIWIPYFLRSERVRNTFTTHVPEAVAVAP